MTMDTSELDALARSPSAASWADITAAANVLPPAELHEGLGALESAVVGWTAENAQALKVMLAQLDARGLPRLRMLDVSQHRYISTQKKDWFAPVPETELRLIVEGTKLSKQIGELRL